MSLAVAASFWRSAGLAGSAVAAVTRTGSSTAAAHTAISPQRPRIEPSRAPTATHLFFEVAIVHAGQRQRKRLGRSYLFARPPVSTCYTKMARIIRRRVDTSKTD